MASCMGEALVMLKFLELVCCCFYNRTCLLFDRHSITEQAPRHHEWSLPGHEGTRFCKLHSTVMCPTQSATPYMQHVNIETESKQIARSTCYGISSKVLLLHIFWFISPGRFIDLWNPFISQFVKFCKAFLILENLLARNITTSARKTLEYPWICMMYAFNEIILAMKL